jgi:hypothetical protein
MFMNTQHKLRLNVVSNWVKSIWAISILVASAVSHIALAADDTAAQKPVVKVAAKSKPTKADAGAKDAKQDAKSLSGMSILGNQEAPKALVIVPWKSSQLGDALDISKTLDDSRQPVDKEVFMRELAYYEIRSASK